MHGSFQRSTILRISATTTVLNPPHPSNSMTVATVQTVGDDVALMTFVRAIARGERARVSALLAAAPELAVASVGAGDQCFVEEISHLVYPGDTALHVAAAAYGASLAHELVKAGAIARAANRRGAERFITRSTGTRLPRAGTRSRSGRRWCRSWRSPTGRLAAEGAVRSATRNAGSWSMVCWWWSWRTSTVQSHASIAWCARATQLSLGCSQ
jgi:hypothetical protein